MRISFELRVLGGTVLQGPDGPVQGRAAHRRRLALLAILAASPGRTIGRERILGYLWPDQPADAGRHQLSEALYVLRKAVGEGAFVTAGDEVGLNPSVISTDLATFRAAVEEERFRDAVEVYGGPFLDGFYVSDAPEFERWVEDERSRLADSNAAALQALAERCEAEGDRRGAAGWWKRLAAHDPYSSRIVVRLMSALAAGDERAAALKHAAAHAAFLREEIGVDPDPAVGELVERLAADTAALPRLDLRAHQGTEELLEPRAPQAAAERADDISPRAEAERIGAPLLDDAASDAHVAAASVPFERPTEPVRFDSRTSPPQAVRSLFARAVGYAGASMLGALFIFGLLRLLPPAAGADAAGEVLDPRRIAVLYFDDHSPDQDLAYLSSGLTEGLIRELSAVPALDVVSRGGVKPYRQRAVPTDSIARQLRAGSLVEASVQKWRDRLRVTVRLVDGNTGRQLDSETVERPVGDLFAMEDELARHVSRFLRRRLGEEIRLRERERGTTNAAALDLVLRAEQLRQDAAQVGRADHARDTASAREILAEADSLLAAAESLDRRWVEPPLLRGWTALAAARVADRPRAVRELRAALVHAERVLSLQPTHPGAMELRGTIQWAHVALDPGADGSEARLDQAENDLRGAIRRNPAQATAWSTLSQFLRFRGNGAEADLAAVRALEADAYLEDAPRVVERLYRSALDIPDYHRARQWCARGRNDYPDDWRFVECNLVLLARDSSSDPDVQRAEALLRQAEALYPAEQARRENRGYTPIHREMVYAAILARAGRTDSARAVLANGRQRLAPGDEALASYYFDEAHVRLLLGEHHEAARVLAKLTELRPHMRDYLSRQPLFRNVNPE